MLTSEDKIKRLNRIGIALTRTTKLEELFEMIVSECRSFTNADAGSLYTLEDGKLIFRVAQNDTLEQRLGYKAPFKAFPLPLSKKSVAGYVALTGEIILVDDCYELDPAKGPAVDRSFDQKNNYRSKSMLTVPMLNEKGAVIGVIQLINSTDEKGEIIPFPEDMVDLMQSIASQAAVALANARYLSEIKNLFAAFVKYSATAIDERSPHTAGHTRRVAGMSMRIATAINETTDGDFADTHFSDQELEELWFAAWLHDIGKIAVKETVLEKSTRISPDRLNWIITRMQTILHSLELDALKKENCSQDALDKEEVIKHRERIKADIEFLEKLNTYGFLSDENAMRLQAIASQKYFDHEGKEQPLLDDFEMQNLGVKRGNLTDTEWHEMRSHVVKTRTIVQNIPFTDELANVANIAAGHHEMLNGTGYPDGLKEDVLPLQARILAVADIFDALTASDRPYKKAIPLEKSIEILQAEVKNGRLDERIVKLVLEKQLYIGHRDDQAEYPWKIEVF